MQKDRGFCYLCLKLHCDMNPKPTEEHHCIHGTANRRLSEKYGLKVYLCHQHHEEGPEAVHKNHKLDRLIQADAQRAFEREYPSLDFLKIFGMNYKEAP